MQPTLPLAQKLQCAQLQSAKMPSNGDWRMRNLIDVRFDHAILLFKGTFQVVHAM